MVCTNLNIERIETNDAEFNPIRRLKFDLVVFAGSEIFFDESFTKISIDLQHVYHMNDTSIRIRACTLIPLIENENVRSDVDKCFFFYI